MNIGQRLNKIETAVNNNLINDPEKALAIVKKVLCTAFPDDGDITEKVTTEEWNFFVASCDRLSSEQIKEVKANIIAKEGFI